MQLTQLRLPFRAELGAPGSPGAALLKSPPSVALGETRCAKPLCLSARSHLSGDVTTGFCRPVLPPWLLFLTCLLLLKGLTNIPKSVSKNCCRIPVSRPAGWPCSNIAVQRQHAGAPTATGGGLLGLSSGTGRNVSPRLRLSPRVDGLGWAERLLSHLT